MCFCIEVTPACARAQVARLRYHRTGLPPVVFTPFRVYNQRLSESESSAIPVPHY
jgi:hypothetical protein